MTTRLLVLVAVLVLAPLAAAHGAPAPKDQDTRLLADMNDDCGGDDAGALSACGGTHDLIALDVREANDAALGDVVVFRFSLNGGDGSLRDVLTLKAGGASKTFELRTNNNKDFQTTGFDRVSGALSLNDGTRFAVEATVKTSALGAPGTKLSDFRIEAYKGTTNGDFMPGTYHTALGNGPTPSSEQGDPQSYVKPDYALRGPGYYVTLTGSGPQQVATGSEVFVQLDAKNNLRSTAQTLTFTVAGADGVTAHFHDVAAPSGEGYTDTLALDLPKAGSTAIHLALHGDSFGSAGTLKVTVRTDLGGLSTLDVPYTVTASAGSSSSSGTPEVNPTSGPKDKDSPAPAAALVGLGLLALAVVARRRA